MTATETIEKKPELTRREFLEVTGVVAGVAGMAVATHSFDLKALSPEGQVKLAAPASSTATWVPTVDRMCSYQCGIRAKVVDGKVVKIDGDPLDGTTKGHICARGQAGLWMSYDPYRVTAPLKRTATSKGPNVDPQWVEISWDEALNTVASNIKTVRAKGADGWVFATIGNGGALSYTQFNTPFVAALTKGITQVEGGMNWCGHSFHYLSRNCHAAFTSRPDRQYCNYLIQFGISGGVEGGLYFTPISRQDADARARGMKTVHIDPRCGVAASKADEWIPIIPGTDGALASAMIYVILNELKTYDVSFVKNWTNGPYLVGPDGTYARDPTSKKALIWDSVDKAAKTYDDPTIKDYALEGTFTVNGATANPGFQLLKNAVQTFTPEWAETVTTVPAATIRRITTEYVAAAQIGSTIQVNGVTYPLRPVAVDYGSNATNHLHGTSNGWSIWLLNTLMGNLDMPGGECQRTNPAFIRAGADGLIESPRASYTLAAPYQFEFPPVTPELEEFFPHGDHFGAISHIVLENPDKFWGIGKHGIDMAIFQATNPMLSMYDTNNMQTLYSSIPFMAYFCLTIEETAQAYADIIIPDTSYLEDYNYITGRLDSGPPLLMQPAMAAPNNIPYLTDTLIDICDRAGILYGKGGFNDQVNTASRLPAKLALDLNTKYTFVQLMDTLTQNYYPGKHLTDIMATGGGTGGVRRGPITTLYAPYQKLKSRVLIYIEEHVKSREALRAKMQGHFDEILTETGVDWNQKLNDYQPLPTWTPSHLHQSTPPYDLIAVAWLSNMHTYTWTGMNPWIAETVVNQDPYQDYIWMNADTAKSKGLNDGDLVTVEADGTGALPGVTRKLNAKVKVSQGIHPQVIGISRSMGGWGRNSVTKNLYKENLAPAYQLLRPDTLQYIDGVTDALENCIKVRVYKVVG